MKVESMSPKQPGNTARHTDDHRCPHPPKGRILRVKHGYNPNSSSIGSLVFVLPEAMLGVTAGFGLVSGIITEAFVKHPKQAEPDKQKDAQDIEEKTNTT